MEALVNKKALYNYEILEKFTAGLVLLGTEAKSLKKGQVSFEGSYITFSGGEGFWVHATIPAYQPRNAAGEYNPLRPRKLLLRKKELAYLQGKSAQRGLTVLPLRVYTAGAHLKLEIGLCRPKKKWDKREALRKQTHKKDAERELREKR
jgi:SsrA-binding protein